jgi:hypothetical protein
LTARGTGEECGVSTTWMIFLALGIVTLAAVLLMMRNRRRDDAVDVAQTEAATHRLYEQEDAEDHARDDRVER